MSKFESNTFCCSLFTLLAHFFAHTDITTHSIGCRFRLLLRFHSKSAEHRTKKLRLCRMKQCVRLSVCVLASNEHNLCEYITDKCDQWLIRKLIGSSWSLQIIRIFRSIVRSQWSIMWLLTYIYEKMVFFFFWSQHHQNAQRWSMSRLVYLFPYPLVY